MNELQRSKLTSHKSTLEVLSQFDFVWNKNPAVSAIVATLTNYMKKILDTVELQHAELPSLDKRDRDSLSINGIFDETDELLVTHLDKSMMEYALSNSDFFQAYAHARTVKNSVIMYDHRKLNETFY